jgi:EAL domain-containing protein (putative c-di-GMP-specific phosphodiesterase class I)
MQDFSKPPQPPVSSDEPRHWSHPVDGLGDDERRLLVDTTSQSRPRIEIDEALRKGWFEIWYQPKIDLKRKCLAGAEALARIHHPTFGVLLPGTFLPNITENSIADLSRHALVTTLQAWPKFDEAGFNLQLAMNIPVSALFKLPIPQLVEEHRPRSERWPGIILEVTEDQIVRDLKRANAIAPALLDSGIKIAIDDFGAGYSSLSSLRELPFVEIKLDHSFVHNCATDATNAAICQTAIDLAHRFGSAAVAEGIESAADLHALMVMGCDFGQGVLIAPPMPQERFLDLLLQRNGRPRAAAGAPEGAAMPAGSAPAGAVDRVA